MTVRGRNPHLTAEPINELPGPAVERNGGYPTGRPSQVQRYPDTFGTVDDSARPARMALTFLLVGTDTHATDPTTGTNSGGPVYRPGGSRKDTTMIAHT